MRKVLLLGMLLLLAACTRVRLQEGDLIFQANDPGGFTGAIENVTGGVWSHVGIIDVRPEGISVLEATTERGVVRTSLDDFLASSAHDAQGRPLVKVFRLSVPDAARLGRTAVRRAETWLGRPYDFAFAEGMEAVYCSELVHASFLQDDGTPVFSARPMIFKGPEGETDPYWTAYYARLGVPIPEGEPGTNPNDLSRDPVLTEIAFF